MALDLANGLSFRKDDPVEIAFGGRALAGTVLNSGEGFMSPYEDMYYLMSAPNQGIQELFAEENEIRSAYVLVSVHTTEIPFSVLPTAVQVRCMSDKQKSAAMTALAVVSGRPGKGEYLLFLEVKDGLKH
jgi:hypothetical protein